MFEKIAYFYKTLDFWISKQWIQYGGRQIENSINFSDTSYLVVFRVTNYESEIKFSKFKMVDQLPPHKPREYKVLKKSMNFSIWRPPLYTRNFKFWKSHYRFVISEQKNPRVQNIRKIDEIFDLSSAILDPSFSIVII